MSCDRRAWDVPAAPGRDARPRVGVVAEDALYFALQEAVPELLRVADRTNSATRPRWSKGIGGCDDSMKLRLSSCGCETRPAKGEPARAGSEPGDGLGNEAGEA